MILKKMTIYEYGNIKEKTISFSAGINVFCEENAGEILAIDDFLHRMLFDTDSSVPGLEYHGSIWFEQAGKNYCLTRNTLVHPSICQLFCEEEQRELNMENGALRELLGGMSEAVYRNSVCLTKPKSSGGADLAREIRKNVQSLMRGKDSSVDLGRSQQMLKMWRKGYQTQKNRSAKEKKQELEKISERLEYLELELDGFRGKKGREEERLNSLEISPEGEKTDQAFREQIQKLQNKDRGMLFAMGFAVVVGLIGFFGRFQAADGMSRIGMDVCMFCAVAVLVYAQSARRKIRSEYARQKKARVRFLSQKEKQKGNLESLESAQRERLMCFTNLQMEYEAYESESSLPTSDDIEIQALNLALDRIDMLSGDIYREFGRRTEIGASRILKELTNGACEEILMNREGAIQIRTFDGTIPLERSGKEILELVYFSVHMAVRVRLLENRQIWFCLENIFENFGNDSLEMILQWLQIQDEQIILYTDREKEMKIMDEKHIPYKKIRLQ